jgi:uncharacterized membrane protein SirB2
LFALGVHGWRAGWFRPGGWSPNAAVWGIWGAASSALLLGWKFFLTAALGDEANLWLDAILYNAVMISMTFFLIGFFMRAGNQQSRAVRFLSIFPAHSYSVYWLHQIVLMPFAYFLKPFSLSIYIKWAMGCAFTIAVCFMLSKYFIKKMPLLRRIF